jgi:hypothetical protein
MPVKACENHDVCAFDDVEHAIWKAPEECTADFAMDCGRGERIALDRLETPVERL